MRKYLLPILLIGFWGCEDSEENADDIYISSDFIMCGQTYQVTISLPSNDTIGVVHNFQWNNFI